MLLSKATRRGFARAFANSADDAKAYPGDRSEFTTKLSFVPMDKVIPTYRILDHTGTVLAPEQEPKVFLQEVKCRLRLFVVIERNTGKDVQNDGCAQHYG